MGSGPSVRCYLQAPAGPRERVGHPAPQGAGRRGPSSGRLRVSPPRLGDPSAQPLRQPGALGRAVPRAVEGVVGTVKRTYGWWKVKLGYPGDSEFQRLRELAPDRLTRQAAEGLLFNVWDACHESDTRTAPRNTILPADTSLLVLLVAAGLLLEGGTIPEETWLTWRVPSSQSAGGEARIKGARRDARGRLVTSAAGRRAPAGTSSNTETERDSDKSENDTKNVERREQRANASPVRLSEELEKAPWNRRK